MGSGLGNAIGVLTGHTGGVYGLCTLELGDRRVLASAGADLTVRVWDPGTGAVITTFVGTDVGDEALTVMECGPGRLAVGTVTGLHFLDVRY